MAHVDWASIVSAALAVILYWNSLHGDFAYDDSRAILRNPDITGESPVADLFVDDFWGTRLTHSGSHKSYRPLCVLSFRWNHLLAANASGVPEPWGFHATNVLLHASVTLLFTLLARSLFAATTPTAFAGLLFAAHPVHTEAVAGIVGRADVGACLFYFLSLAAYMKYCLYRGKSHLNGASDQYSSSSSKSRSTHSFLSSSKCPRNAYRLLFSPKKGSPTLAPSGGGFVAGADAGTPPLPLCFHQRWRPLSSSHLRLVFLTVSVISGFLSMLFKELGITVFGICLLYDLFIIHRLTVRCLYHIFSKACLSHLREGVSVLVLSCVSLLLLRIWLMGFKTPEFAASDNPAAHDPNFIVRTLTYFYLPVFNFGLLLFPSTLSFDWSMDAIPLLCSFKDQRNVLSVIFYLWLGYVALRSWWSASSTLTSFLDNAESSSQNDFDGSKKETPSSDSRETPRSATGSGLKSVIAEPHPCLCARRHVFPGNAAGAEWWRADAARGREATVNCSQIPETSGVNDSEINQESQLPLFGFLVFPCIRWTRMDRVLLALALLVIPFLPATNLFFSVGFVVAERIIYIPSAGFCLLVTEGFVCLLNMTPSKPKIIPPSSSSPSSKPNPIPLTSPYANLSCIILHLLAFGVVVALSVRTWRRNVDWQTEENLYLAGIKVNPPKAWGNLANILTAQRRHAEAEAAYRQALLHRPNMADVHYNLGILLQELGRRDEAIESYHKAITCRPKLTVAHLNMGIVLMQSGRKNEAQIAYQNCWNVDSSGLKDPRLHESAKISCLYNLARLESEKGNSKEAIRLYHTAVAERPDHYPPQSLYNMLGEAYVKDGDLTQGRLWYEKALAVKPDHVPAHLTMAHLAYIQGDAGAADSWFLRALSISPDSTEALHHYAQHLVETRRFEAAVEIYRKALTISPDDFEVTFNLANCYRQLRHHKDAEKFYRRAVEIKPEAPTAHMNLGAILHLTGKLEEAEKFYLEALRLKPEDGTTKTNLVKLKQLRANAS